jgi:hypothetical protein
MLNWGQNGTPQQNNLLLWTGSVQPPQKPNGSLISDVAKTISNDIHKIHILILWRPQHRGFQNPNLKICADGLFRSLEKHQTNGLFGNTVQ